MTLEAKIKRGNLLVTEISIDTGEKPLSHSLILLQSKVNNYLSQMINSGDDGNGNLLLNSYSYEVFICIG